MANLPVKDAGATTKYLSASGVGTDLDPHVVEHEVIQGTAADLNVTEASAAAILAAVDAIKTAVELLDNAVGGSELQVDIVADGAGLALAAGQLADGHNVTIDNAAGAAAVNVQDGGNSLTVDGAVTIGAALPAGSNNIGDVDVLSSALPSGAATAANQSTIIGHVDGIETVLGTMDVDTGALAATLGLSMGRSIDVDESEDEIKGSAGTLYGYYLYNLHATDKRYIKFYNAPAASVTVGTTEPVLTIPLAAGQGANVSFSNGVTFSSGICVAATTGVLDNDTGAPGANEVIVNVFYK